MVKDSIQTLFARLFAIVGKFIYTVVITRVLGREGKGFYEIIMTVPMILMNFGFFGFEHSNVYFAGKKPKSIPTLIANSVVLGIVLGIASAFFGFLYYLIFEDKYVNIYKQFGYLLVLAPIIITPLQLIPVYFDMIIYGTNRIWVRNLKDVLNTVLRLFFPIILVVVLKFWVPGAVWAFIIMSLCLFIYSLYFLQKFFKGRMGRFDWATVKESFAFGKYEYLSNFATFLFYKADVLLLFLLLPDKPVNFIGSDYSKESLIGIYSMAVTGITMIWTIPDSITTALKPKITMKGEPERRKLVPPSLRMCLITVTIISIISALIVKPALGILLGSGSGKTEDWTIAAIPFYWLIPGILTLSMAKIFATDLFSRGKPYYATWISMFSLVTNLVLNFILIPRTDYYGNIVGAALASSISYSLSFVLFCIVYIKESGTTLGEIFIPRWSDFVEIWHKILVLLGLRKDDGLI